MKTLTATLIIIFSIIALPYLYRILELETISKSDIPKEGAWASLSLGNVFYQIHNPTLNLKEETIVLIHGFSTPSFVWNGMLDQLLSQGYKVITFDHYGRGFSERPKAVYNKDLYVTELLDLLDYLEISEPVHLVGYSMGGPIAGFFTDEYSEKVASLSLISPAGFNKPKAFSNTNEFVYRPLIGEWFFNVFRQRFENTLMPETERSDDLNAINQQDYKRLFKEQFKYKGLIESLLSTIRNFDMYSTLDMYSRLGESNKPILVIWGKLDGVVPYFASNQIREVIPQAELVTIENGTHDITYRQPSQVGEAISIFLVKTNL
tara:strand:+ start:837 stop:1796 length:960 start_codon:yes stop_codon:yes gene_type:complete